MHIVKAIKPLKFLLLLPLSKTKKETNSSVKKNKNLLEICFKLDFLKVFVKMVIQNGPKNS